MNSIKLNKQIAEELEKISEAAGYMWQKGWIESNGGNLSADITHLLQKQEIDFKNLEIIKTQLPAGAENMIVLVTGKGCRLRELAKNPEKAACIIATNSNGDGYSIIWNGGNGMKPTSELASHLKIHVSNRQQKNGKSAILHAHPPGLIALSHYSGADADKIPQMLWRMMPEVRIFLPKGILFLSYRTPGSSELADITAESLMNCDVAVWKKHGAVASGKDIIEAFDLIDVAEKGAQIYLSCLKSGIEPEGLSYAEMKDLEKFIA